VRLTTNGQVMLNDEPAAVELRDCVHPSRCAVRACHVVATIIVRSVNASGQLLKQYTLCPMHADQVSEARACPGSSHPAHHRALNKCSPLVSHPCAHIALAIL
jgi:hypothetical protein